QRLVHLMQMRLAGAASEPGAAEVDALARREADALARPARVRFHHIFAGGDRAEERLRALAQRQPAPADAARLSDPLLLAAQIGPAHEAGIARDFGPSFAAAVMRLPAGQWSAPVRSAYGAHLVWVERHWPAVAADPDYARERARLALRATSQEQAQTEATRALRSRYRVRHGSGGEP
ncbi:MAG: peptidyl-prolyl cis-trans isomerase, partial [Gammaproteobacteria bacterium]|nr:peptidyl-prolyl cis-trans isomerase [Gammaproteobacteria bacterium]